MTRSDEGSLFMDVGEAWEAAYLTIVHDKEAQITMIFHGEGASAAHPRPLYESLHFSGLIIVTLLLRVGNSITGRGRPS